MGLLDELEQEAERQRAINAQLAAERERRERHWNERLLPAMQSLDAYLQRLARNLALIKRRTRIVYPLPGYGDLVAYLEPSFVLQSMPATASYELTLEGLATINSDECPLVECDNPQRVRSVSTVLQQHRLSGMSDARRDANGDVRAASFRAKGRIPYHLSILAEAASGQVRMVFQNYEGLGQSSRTFTAEQLDETLFDALGRFIMREEPHFAREAVADDIRRQLQSRIQRDNIKREWENKLSRQPAEDEANVVASLDPSSRPGGLFGRLRLMSRRLIGR
jgi:hypothetical protein